MGALHAAKIIGDLGFEHGIDRLGEIMPQQDVFGRNRAICLELEHPMAVGLLEAEDAFGGRRNARFQVPEFLGFAAGRVHGIHLARLLR
ncbi:hypothetical protein ACVWXL_001793 [Bradyrhizobium sp. GM22.5]